MRITLHEAQKEQAQLREEFDRTFDENVKIKDVGCGYLVIDDFAGKITSFEDETEAEKYVLDLHKEYWQESLFCARYNWLDGIVNP